MKVIILILLLSFSYIETYAQKQERDVLLYNVAFGGIIAGVGSVINKPKKSDWKKIFVKGFWQGSAGGLLNYTGKKTIYLNNKHQTANYSWPSKILHSAGLSIIENAALNEPFLQNWNIDYGPVRFDFSINKAKKFKARFLPASIYSVIFASQFGNFDFKNTLLSGNIVFSKKEISSVSYSSTKLGVSYGRALFFANSSALGINKYLILSHEIIHQYQYGDYQLLNTWLKPLEKKVKSKLIRNLFTNYIYADIPYSLLSYNLASRNNRQNYFRNFYEFEAQRFSTNRFVPR